MDKQGSCLPEPKVHPPTPGTKAPQVPQPPDTLQLPGGPTHLKSLQLRSGLQSQRGTARQGGISTFRLAPEGLCSLRQAALGGQSLPVGQSKLPGGCLATVSGTEGGLWDGDVQLPKAGTWIPQGSSSGICFLPGSLGTQASPCPQTPHSPEEEWERRASVIGIFGGRGGTGISQG